MISIELWRARIGIWGTRKIRNSCLNPSQLVVTCDISLPLLACVIYMLLVIGGVESNPGPKNQDKEVTTEFSLNVPNNFEFVEPSEAPIQFVASSTMCKSVYVPKRKYFGKKRNKVFHGIRSFELSPPPVPCSQVTITDEFQDLELNN